MIDIVKPLCRTDSAIEMGFERSEDDDFKNAEEKDNVVESQTTGISLQEVGFTEAFHDADGAICSVSGSDADDCYEKSSLCDIKDSDEFETDLKDYDIDEFIPRRKENSETGEIVEIECEHGHEEGLETISVVDGSETDTQSNTTEDEFRPRRKGYSENGEVMEIQCEHGHEKYPVEGHENISVVDGSETDPQSNTTEDEFRPRRKECSENECENGQEEYPMEGHENISIVDGSETDPQNDNTEEEVCGNANTYIHVIVNNADTKNETCLSQNQVPPNADTKNENLLSQNQVPLNSEELCYDRIDAEAPCGTTNSSDESNELCLECVYSDILTGSDEFEDAWLKDESFVSKYMLQCVRIYKLWELLYQYGGESRSMVEIGSTSSSIEIRLTRNNYGQTIFQKQSLEIVVLFEVRQSMFQVAINELSGVMLLKWPIQINSRDIPADFLQRIKNSHPLHSLVIIDNLPKVDKLKSQLDKVTLTGPPNGATLKSNTTDSMTEHNLDISWSCGTDTVTPPSCVDIKEPCSTCAVSDGTLDNCAVTESVKDESESVDLSDVNSKHKDSSVIASCHTDQSYGLLVSKQNGYTDEIGSTSSCIEIRQTRNNYGQTIFQISKQSLEIGVLFEVTQSMFQVAINELSGVMLLKLPIQINSRDIPADFLQRIKNSHSLHSLVIIDNLPKVDKLKSQLYKVTMTGPPNGATLKSNTTDSMTEHNLDTSWPCGTDTVTPPSCIDTQESCSTCAVSDGTLDNYTVTESVKDESESVDLSDVNSKHKDSSVIASCHTDQSYGLLVSKQNGYTDEIGSTSSCIEIRQTRNNYGQTIFQISKQSFEIEVLFEVRQSMFQVAINELSGVMLLKWSLQSIAHVTVNARNIPADFLPALSPVSDCKNVKQLIINSCPLCSLVIIDNLPKVDKLKTQLNKVTMTGPPNGATLKSNRTDWMTDQHKLDTSWPCGTNTMTAPRHIHTLKEPCSTCAVDCTLDNCAVTESVVDTMWSKTATGCPINSNNVSDRNLDDIPSCTAQNVAARKKIQDLESDGLLDHSQSGQIYSFQRESQTKQHFHAHNVSIDDEIFNESLTNDLNMLEHPPYGHERKEAVLDVHFTDIADKQLLKLTIITRANPSWAESGNGAASNWIKQSIYIQLENGAKYEVQTGQENKVIIDVKDCETDMVMCSSNIPGQPGRDHGKKCETSLSVDRAVLQIGHGQCWPKLFIPESSSMYQEHLEEDFGCMACKGFKVLTLDCQRVVLNVRCHIIIQDGNDNVSVGVSSAYQEEKNLEMITAQTCTFEAFRGSEGHSMAIMVSIKPSDHYLNEIQDDTQTMQSEKRMSGVSHELIPDIGEESDLECDVNPVFDEIFMPRCIRNGENIVDEMPRCIRNGENIVDEMSSCISNWQDIEQSTLRDWDIAGGREYHRIEAGTLKEGEVREIYSSESVDDEAENDFGSNHRSLSASNERRELQRYFEVNRTSCLYRKIDRHFTQGKINDRLTDQGFFNSLTTVGLELISHLTDDVFVFRSESLNEFVDQVDMKTFITRAVLRCFHGMEVKETLCTDSIDVEICTCRYM